MKTMKHLIQPLSFMAMIGAALLAASCSQEPVTEIAENVVTPGRNAHHATMTLNAAAPQFDPADTRAAEDWDDGDRLYVQFVTGKDDDGNAVYVNGSAIYDATKDMWGITYYGNLEKTAESKCELYFFVNPQGEYPTAIHLNEHTVIYRDAAATYDFDGTMLSVTATLKPMTGRIRFAGTEGQTISTPDLSTYTVYDIVNNAFSAVTSDIDVTVGADGYSPYIYGFFPDGAAREITIYDADDNEFYRKLGQNALAQGRSGYLTIPTEDSHSGWTLVPQEMEISVNTKTFKMKRVRKGTFFMGKGGPVTLTKSYYMGETEVTQGLWGVLSAATQPYDKGVGDDFPVYYVSWSDCQNFLSALNQKTKMSFRLPTEAEWEYAARGGNKSMGYEYAGSNDINEVAWYNGNANSTTHAVKTKKPNELGFYDMSGNVWEWCADWYGNLTSDAQTDPTGPDSGYSRVHRGGCWAATAESSRCVFRTSDPSGYRATTVGFRLAL